LGAERWVLAFYFEAFLQTISFTASVFCPSEFPLFISFRPDSLNMIRRVLPSPDTSDLRRETPLFEEASYPRTFFPLNVFFSPFAKRSQPMSWFFFGAGGFFLFSHPYFFLWDRGTYFSSLLCFRDSPLTGFTIPMAPRRFEIFPPPPRPPPSFFPL